MSDSNISTVVETSVAVSGLTVTARKLSVLDNAMTADSARFLSTHCSNKKIRDGVAEALRDHDYQKMVRQCSHGSYDTLALWLAAETGYSWKLNRAVFEALPFRFDAEIEKCQLSKSGGMTTNKDGVQVPNATLRRWMTLKAVCTEVVSDAAKMHEDRKVKEEIEAHMIEQAVAGL